MIVKRSGLWMLFRVQGGAYHQLRRGFLPEDTLGPPGHAAVVQLSCEPHRGTGPLRFGLQINGKYSVRFQVRPNSPGALPPPKGNHVGIAVMHVSPNGSPTTASTDAVAVYEAK